MDNYVAVVFDSDQKAYDGLHTLWKLDAAGDITVHGAAVIHRDAYGQIDVATKDTDPGLRTALGVGGSEPSSELLPGRSAPQPERVPPPEQPRGSAPW